MKIKNLLSGFCASVFLGFSAVASAGLPYLAEEPENNERILAGVYGSSVDGLDKWATSNIGGAEENGVLSATRSIRSDLVSGLEGRGGKFDTTEKWLVAEASSAKGRLFGSPESVVGVEEQTKEWQARTLRTMGIVELSGGALMALGGLALISDSGIAGAIMGGIGAFWAYLGYTDLKAANRFFYPKPLLSRKLKEEKYDHGDFEMVDKAISLVDFNKRF